MSVVTYKVKCSRAPPHPHARNARTPAHTCAYTRTHPRAHLRTRVGTPMHTHRRVCVCRRIPIATISYNKRFYAYSKKLYKKLLTIQKQGRTMATINRNTVALGEILTLLRYQGVLVKQGRNVTTERP